MASKTNDDWVLLKQLKQLLKASEPESGKVDGGKESSGAVAGNSNTTKDAEQKKTDPDVVSSSSSPTQARGLLRSRSDCLELGSQSVALGSLPLPLCPEQSTSTDEPVPDKQSTTTDVVPATPIPNPLSALIGTIGAAGVFGGKLASDYGGSALSRKRRYFTGAFNIPDALTASTNANTVQLTDIAVGTDSDQRIGPAIRVKRIVIHVFEYPLIALESTGQLDPCVILHYIVVDKIPSLLNTPPSLVEVGTINPIISTSRSIYNQLGNTGGGAVMVAVRNPLTELLYDVRHHHRYFPAAQNLIYQTHLGSNAIGQVPPTRHWRTMDLAMDDLVVYADGTTASYPLINAMWFYPRTDVPLTLQNRSEQTMYGGYIEFEDEVLQE